MTHGHVRMHFSKADNRLINTAANIGFTYNIGANFRVRRAIGSRHKAEFAGFIGARRQDQGILLA